MRSASADPEATGPELIDEFVALDLTIDTYLDRNPDLMTRIDYEQFVKAQRAQRALWLAKGEKS